MGRKIKINEADLRGMIRESVKRALSEVRGWELEKDDVTWVNGEESGGKPWMVRIWPGAGYYLPAWGAYAHDEEEALCYVVAYMEKEFGGGKYFVDDEVEMERYEMERGGMDPEDIDMKIDEWALYVDATMEGAEEPHYIFSENLSVYPYDEKKFRN